MDKTKKYTISQAAKIIGIHPDTLDTWVQKGKIVPSRTPGGHMRFSEAQIRSLMGDKISEIIENKVVAYARVSTGSQAADGSLDEQKKRLTEYCEENEYELLEIYEDIASGLNGKRGGLHKLFKVAKDKKFSRVIVEYPDRLCRFGYEYIEVYLNSLDIEIEVINQKPDKSLEQEVMDDILGILASFTGRIYGKRGAENKRKKKLREEMEKESGL